MNNLELIIIILYNGILLLTIALPLGVVNILTIIKIIEHTRKF
jgi:hypothetical protein